MITDDTYNDLVSQFLENDEFGLGIFQQIWAEKNIGGFNFPTDWVILEWYGPTYKGKDGSTWVAKYWREA